MSLFFVLLIKTNFLLFFSLRSLSFSGSRFSVSASSIFLPKGQAHFLSLV
jgi:hypothetical protein